MTGDTGALEEADMCPACSAQLQKAEVDRCPSCGLFLGEPMPLANAVCPSDGVGSAMESVDEDKEAWRRRNSGWMHRLGRVVGWTILVPACYVAWWHVAFVMVFGSRGDSMDREVYAQYVSAFLFGLGLEVPTFIQLIALMWTLITIMFVVYWPKCEAARIQMPPDAR